MRRVTAVAVKAFKTDANVMIVCDGWKRMYVEMSRSSAGNIVVHLFSHGLAIFHLVSQKYRLGHLVESLTKWFLYEWRAAIVGDDDLSSADDASRHVERY
jgi:gluconate kinase